MRKSRSFELIVALHPLFGPSLYAVSLLRRRKTYWIWTYGRDIWSEWPLFIERSINRASKIIAVSNYTRDSILRRLKNPREVEVMYPPVDTDVFTPGEVKKEAGRAKYLLTVSRIGKEDMYKGHDKVIEALPEIRNRIEEEVIYRIVGSGAGVPMLEGIAREHGVEHAVEFLGNLDRRALVEEYQKCDVFIMPSRMEMLENGDIRGEGLGIVYVEAAACGKPVIVSSQGGAVEAVIDGKTGIAVNPFSSEEITKATCYILSNPGLACDMGIAGREFVKKRFSVQRYRAKIEALLEGD